VLEFNGSLKPYLTASAGAHAALVVSLAFFAGGTTVKRDKVYRIDFIGDTGTILNRSLKTPGGKTAAVKAVKKARQPLGRPKFAPMRDPDTVALGKPTFSRSKLKPSFIRPRTKPSRSVPKTRQQVEPAPPARTAAAGTSQTPSAGTGAASGSGGGSASVSADMPDFPYPWYLQRLRATLWNRWSLKMPAGPAECGIVFTVMKDGKVVDLRVEITSGDAAYDLAAMNTVKDTAPFPPLPPQFPDRFLKVHVQFKS
jgi:protein TonB